MNPFKENNQILPIASINSVYIDDVLASDLFRLELIIDELKKNREILGFSSELSNIEIFNKFNELLASNISERKEIATKIAISFGEKLAALILTLKKPSKLAIKNRPEWKKAHWDFWNKIENIYFVGGLTSPILINIFYNEITKALLENKITNLNIRFIEGSLNLGTKGLTNLTKDGEYLLFDFGQTNIKRRYIVKKTTEIEIDTILPIIKSQFLFHKDISNEELKQAALKLDNFIIMTIIDTVNAVNFKGNNIIMAIANYVINGKIYEKRGGYAKLALLNDNYERHLKQALSKLLKRDIQVQLVHDTSAMALNFNKVKRSAVVSLGTAFGIAFPE